MGGQLDGGRPRNRKASVERRGWNRVDGEHEPDGVHRLAWRSRDQPRTRARRLVRRSPTRHPRRAATKAVSPDPPIPHRTDPPNVTSIRASTSTARFVGGAGELDPEKVSSLAIFQPRGDAPSPWVGALRGEPHGVTDLRQWKPLGRHEDAVGVLTYVLIDKPLLRRHARSVPGANETNRALRRRNSRVRVPGRAGARHRTPTPNDTAPSAEGAPDRHVLTSAGEGEPGRTGTVLGWCARRPERAVGAISHPLGHWVSR